ncbi:ABC transporter substrate-binding protein [Saccharopolyspora gregorii]|uniref:ABC transporter substrate-binding protein n=1 Tax=Saccharopolyspora gregorii TaxID=33914 RepID=UPI0021AC5838|nr:ABC transporter substrate-binding protein [Saccharopolyspora gregorii]
MPSRPTGSAPRGTRRRVVRALLSIATIGVSTFALSGCGLLSGSDGASDGGNGTLEKTTVVVGSLPALSQAPIAVAQAKGYFAEEGLTVKVQPVSDGPAALTSLISGQNDVSLGSYTAPIKAQATGAADLKIISEMMISVPNTMNIMVLPGSKIKKPEDLAGAKIAYSAPGAITDIGTKAALQDRGIDVSDDQFVRFGFPEMLPALQNGQIDAAVMTEPFITQAAKNAGAVSIMDAFSGGTADFPVAGAMTTAKFAEENPNTLQAFQRAVHKAQVTGQNRAEVTPLLPQFAKISPELAPIVELGKIPTSMDAARLQRVADLMQRFGQIDKHIDVAQMLVQPPPFEDNPTGGA